MGPQANSHPVIYLNLVSLAIFADPDLFATILDIPEVLESFNSEKPFQFLILYILSHSKVLDDRQLCKSDNLKPKRFIFSFYKHEPSKPSICWLLPHWTCSPMSLFFGSDMVPPCIGSPLWSPTSLHLIRPCFIEFIPRSSPKDPFTMPSR